MIEWYIFDKDICLAYARTYEDLPQVATFWCLGYTILKISAEVQPDIYLKDLVC